MRGFAGVAGLFGAVGRVLRLALVDLAKLTCCSCLFAAGGLDRPLPILSRWDVRSGGLVDVEYGSSCDLRIRKNVTDKSVEMALLNLINQRSAFYADIMRNLPTRQAKVLSAFSHHGGHEITGKLWMRNAGQTNTSSVKKSASALVKKELVWVHEKDYRIGDPFFGVWLQMNYAQR